MQRLLSLSALSFCFLLTSCIVAGGGGGGGSSSGGSNLPPYQESETTPNDTPSQAVVWDLSKYSTVQGRLDGAKDTQDLYVVTLPTLPEGQAWAVTVVATFSTCAYSLDDFKFLTVFVFRSSPYDAEKPYSMEGDHDSTDADCSFRRRERKLVVSGGERIFPAAVATLKSTASPTSPILYSLGLTYTPLGGMNLEREPNDTFSAALDLGTLDSTPRPWLASHGMRLDEDSIKSVSKSMEDLITWDAFTFDNDLFKFTVPATLKGPRVVITVTDPTAMSNCRDDPTTIEVYKSDPAQGVEWTSGSPTPCSTLGFYSVYPGETRYFRIKLTQDQFKSFNYSFTVTAYPSGYAFEIEPNDTISTANDFDALQVNGRVYGWASYTSDLYDYFKFHVPTPNMLVTIETLDGLDHKCIDSTIDPEIRLYDSMGSLIDFDYDSGPGYCAYLQKRLTSAGDYYVQVEAGLGPYSIRYPQSYSLSIRLTP